MPVSTAEYNPCGWRAWLNNTTITLGLKIMLWTYRRHLSMACLKTAMTSGRPISGGGSGMRR